MKAPKDKLIVVVDLQQRSNYMIRYGSLELWMDSSFGEDGKMTNPVMAEVVVSAVDGYKQGDMVLCHYNTFSSFVTDTYRLGSHEDRDEQGRMLFTIYPAQVKAVLDEEGLPVPVNGNILVKRIPAKVQSSLIIPEVANKHEMVWFEVDRTAGDKPYKKGDVILCYKFSDLAIHYTVNKVPVECYVVKEDDVNGVMHG